MSLLELEDIVKHYAGAPHAGGQAGARSGGVVVSTRAVLLALLGGILATCLASTLPLLDLRRGRVYFTYNGSPNVSARFTIHAAGGNVYGSAKCRLNNPNSPTPSFRGALVIVGGSGRYAHARGSGELFGVFHRRGYGLVVQAIGKLSY